jgi:hypothetical protein
MNISKIRILAAVRRDLKDRYKSFPPEVRDHAIDNLMPVLDQLPQTWYDNLPEPGTENDYLITEIVRAGIAKLTPELLDRVRH